MTSERIHALLRERHALPEWVLAFEVANGTGSQAQRYADAVAMNCFPSKGCEILGFEIKVSRSDWLRELKKSGKSVPVARFCDRWYVVAPDGIVKREELPRGWGLIVGKDDALRVAVQPPVNEEAKDVTRSFMASMLRRVGRLTDEATKEVERRAVQRTEAVERQRVRDSLPDSVLERKYAELQANVQAFETASGLSIRYGWDLPAVGKAVKALQNVGDLSKKLERWRGELATLDRKIGEVLELAVAGEPMAT